MTIGNQSRAMLESLLLRSLDIAFGLYAPLKTMWVVMAHRQNIREYRKRNQLNQKELLVQCWELPVYGRGER